MLETLRHIVQEVNSARDMGESLQIVVARVREAIATQACTIYLLDNRHDEYLMIATEGLNPNAIRHLRIGVEEGLVGLVGDRKEPINLDNAPSHPNFLYSPDVGEERYKAFLGVPIIHHRQLLGVMVVQQIEQRRFDEAEEAFLITLSAQLAGVIAHAEAIGFDIHAGQAYDLEEDVASLGGMPCVAGVGIGTGLIVYPQADLNAVPDRTTDDIDAEIHLFEEALQSAREDIQALSERLDAHLPPEEKALFDAYLGILDKASLGVEVIAEIRKGSWAQGALHKVINQHVQHFSSMDDPYFRERATDLKDLGQRVLSHLQKQFQRKKVYPEQTILVGDEISAADLAEVPEGRLVAVVSVKGSSNSHVAILARALRIPTVMGVSGQPLSSLEGKELIVDGYYGHVYVAPSSELREEFKHLAEEERELDAGLESLRGLPTCTPDGHAVELQVNTGLVTDAALSLSVGSAGVGLFRSEISFMGRENFPTEAEQRAMYQQVLGAFEPQPVTIRTLDIGGDKALPYFPIEEDNPFLGWRGIRVTLDHPEVFLVQARAMMRASEGLNNLRIMLPMVATTTELDDALHLLNRAYEELLDEGVGIEKPKIGVMIEVPSAVYQVRNFAKRVDFLSVGSNDLTQYLLAVDRNNSRVADLYDALHPAVLCALKEVVQGAHDMGKPIGICGEMAGDPVSAILLLALGFDTLSMNAGSLLRVKWVIHSFSLAYARELLDELLQFDNPTMIRFRLEQALDEAGLGGLIRAGK